MYLVNILASGFFILVILTGYNFSKLSFFLFTFFSLLFLNLMFRKKSTFLDKFSGIFFFLCFYINFTFKIFLENIFKGTHYFYDGIGNFQFNNENINFVFIICIVTYISIFSVSIIRERFFNYNLNKKNHLYNDNLKNFYIKHKLKILLIYFGFIFLLIFINISDLIYIRGLVAKENTTIKYNIFALFFLYLIPATTCFLIDLDNNSVKKKDYAFYSYSLIEPLLLNFGMNSRNNIFESMGYAIGYIYTKYLNISRGQIILFFSLIFLFFVLNFVAVSEFFPNRDKLLLHNHQKVQTATLKNNIKIEEVENIKNDENTEKNQIVTQNQKTNIAEIFRPLVHSKFGSAIIARLIGIEGIMVVVSNRDNLSFNTFFRALNAEESAGKPSFYDLFKNEVRANNYCNNIKCNTNFTLMGIVAFLMYSGSLYFLFFALFTIFSFFSFIEFIAFRFTRNIILSSLISQILLYRCIHFGYLPLNSYKIIVAIFLSIGLVYILNLTLNYLINEICPNTSEN